MEFWTKLHTFFASTQTQLTTLAWVVFAVAGIVAGIMFATGREGSQAAKGILTKIVIGVAVVAGITAIITTVASMMGGSATF